MLTGKYAILTDKNGNFVVRYNRGNENMGMDAETETYTYDVFNRLTGYRKNDGPQVSYTYRADGKRKSKIVNGVETEFVWDGDNMIMSGTEKYSYGVGGIEFSDACTYVKDIHGNVISGIDGEGNILSTYNYDSFGNVLKADGSMQTDPFRYCGEYTDTESGLIYLRNRYYDPSIGRFITEDPIRDGSNWYIYCDNNPVMYVDSTGLLPSLEDAAEMASRSYNTYNMSRSGLERRKLGDGWRLIDEWKGSEGLVIHIYVRGDSEYSSYTGAKEYAFVNKGSSTWGDWVNNFQQPFGWSTDMSESIANAEYFSNGDCGNYEITFIGHSKGGAEAAANAVATNRNAILFNPAAVALNEYGLNANTYSADMTVYVVKGEPLNALNSLLGAKAIDKYETLPFYSWNPIKNHSMEAVKSGVKGR